MIAEVLKRLGWRNACLLFGGSVLIVLMRKSLPSYAEKLALIEIRGEPKQRVAAQDFAVTVEGFRLAHRYRTDGEYASDNETRVLQTPGIWLALAVKTEMLRKPGIIRARLRTRDGLDYSANDEQRPRVRNLNLADQPSSPGLPRTGAYFFELPPEKLPGAHVQFYVGTQVPDSLIDIDLGTGKATPAELLGEAAAEIDLKQ